jgi:hypothetical protein
MRSTTVVAMEFKVTLLSIDVTSNLLAGFGVATKGTREVPEGTSLLYLVITELRR